MLIVVDLVGGVAVQIPLALFVILLRRGARAHNWTLIGAACLFLVAYGFGMANYLSWLGVYRP